MFVPKVLGGCTEERMQDPMWVRINPEWLQIDTICCSSAFQRNMKMKGSRSRSGASCEIVSWLVMPCLPSISATKQPIQFYGEAAFKFKVNHSYAGGVKIGKPQMHVVRRSGSVTGETNKSEKGLSLTGKRRGYLHATQRVCKTLHYNCREK